MYKIPTLEQAKLFYKTLGEWFLWMGTYFVGTVIVLAIAYLILFMIVNRKQVRRTRKRTSRKFSS